MRKQCVRSIYSYINHVDRQHEQIVMSGHTKKGIVICVTRKGITSSRAVHADAVLCQHILFSTNVFCSSIEKRVFCMCLHDIAHFVYLKILKMLRNNNINCSLYP